MEVVNQFLIAYLGMKGDAEAALKGFDQAKQKAILAWYSVATPQQLDAVIDVITDDDESAKVKIRNTPLTSYARGQSVFGDTAAANLANISADQGVCVCKGADGAYLLAAMDTQNIFTFGEDAAYEVVKDIAFQKEKTWTMSREAYAGSFIEPRAETVKDAVQSLLEGENPFAALQSQISNEVTALDEIIEESLTGEGEEDG